MTLKAQRPGFLTVCRDILSYCGGWFLIIYQALFVPPKDVNEWFLLLGGSLIGVPGVAEIIAWRGRTTGGGQQQAPSDSASRPS